MPEQENSNSDSDLTKTEAADWSTGATGIEDFLNVGIQRSEPPVETKEKTDAVQTKEEKVDTEVKTEEQQNEEIVEHKETKDDKQVPADEQEKLEQEVAETEKNKQADEAANKETTQQETKVASEFEGFTVEEQKVLKKMAPDARKFVVNRLREFEQTKEEKKQLEQKLTATEARIGKPNIPLSYYENPNAINLVPEYQQTRASLVTAGQVRDHWDMQLERIRQGEEWQDLIDVLDKNGNPTGEIKLGPKQKASDEALSEVKKHFKHSLNQFDELEQSEYDMRVSFIQQVKATRDNISRAENDIFKSPAWKDKNSVEFKRAEVVRGKMQEMGITPQNPAYELLAKTAASYLLLREWAVAEFGKKEKQQKIQADQRRAGPSGNSTNSGGSPSGGGGKVGDTIEDFQKAMRGD